uniref:Uncharacterized protein n=1 Tax=Magallana gigas TaxID=29159 RepID=A0A8W8LBS8_MAGGI
MDVDFLEDEFKIEEIDDLTSSQDWNFLGKDENISKKPTTSPKECTDNSIALNTPAPNIPECSVFPETSATVHSEEEPMSKRPRFPFGEFKNCNITFQF